MHEFLEFLKNLTDPVWISNHGGLYIVVLIIFAETGLFVGFFLPGDSLLFITGMIIANSLSPFDSEAMNLVYWMSLITIAGIIGNSVGYWFGKKSGPLLFERRETWIFKRKHVMHAKEFYDKKGGGAIILARFLPIIRTFAPIVAGVVKMDPKKFTFFNIVGCILWVVSLIMAGYLLGGNLWVKDNLEYILIGIVVITTAPVLIKLFFSKKKDPTMEVAKDIAEEKIKTPAE
ncbi:MAG TPA: VTT domain-containing protein [Segetibacter sp.]|jgi:membrane-associated protein